MRSTTNGVEWLTAPGWGELEWLWHGFSTRRGGLSRAYATNGAANELNLGFTPDDDRETVMENRRRLAEAITGSANTPLVAVRQFHSNLVVCASGPDAGREEPSKADGLMTNAPGQLLAIQTADCIPVLVADGKRRAVAAFHAGWRGTVQRIVESGIGRMAAQYGSRPEDLVAAIGPGIGPCCYAVGDEVLSSFESQFSYFAELFHRVPTVNHAVQRPDLLSPDVPSPASALHLDLMEANRRQLLAAGVHPSAIQLVGGCTSCQPELFYSHRASKGHAGRMMSVIGIRA